MIETVSLALAIAVVLFIAVMVSRRLNRKVEKTVMKKVDLSEYPYIFTGALRPPNRYGDRCKLIDPKNLAYRPTSNTKAVEFTDGQQFIVDSRYVRKAV